MGRADAPAAAAVHAQLYERINRVRYNLPFTRQSALGGIMCLSAREQLAVANRDTIRHSRDAAVAAQHRRAPGSLLIRGILLAGMVCGRGPRPAAASPTPRVLGRRAVRRRRALRQPTRSVLRPPRRRTCSVEVEGAGAGDGVASAR